MTQNIDLHEWVKAVNRIANKTFENKERQQADLQNTIRHVENKIPAIFTINFLTNLKFIREVLRYPGPVPFTEQDILEDNQ